MESVGGIGGSFQDMNISDFQALRWWEIASGRSDIIQKV
jgi:hypothetical protein